MNRFQDTRRRQQATAPGSGTDDAFSVTRRIFLRKSTAATVAVGAAGWLSAINLLEFAHAQNVMKPFRIAWISDSHLYHKNVNQRFVDKTVRAVEEVKAMHPAPDFYVYGGDLAQLGDPVELDLGNEILKELNVKRMIIPGEHDWYLDLGKKWRALFGETHWSFDHKGVRFIGIDTVTNAPDYWSATNMSPKERMGHMATLDGTVAGPWSGLGDAQLKWLQDRLSGWSKDAPVVLFSHNPLYEYYPPWNFWVRDWRSVHEIVSPFKNVTNIHGHTHQPLYNEISGMRSIGMLATAWPWPYAPEGVPELTRAMVRVDPGDHFDGVGWNELNVNVQARVENRFRMFSRKHEDVLATAPYDSGTGDNETQRLHRRIADRMWPY